MDHRYIRDHQIVDQYLRNQLTEVEAASFEEHYFECAECLEELEVAKSFGEGLADVASPARPAGSGRNRWLIASALAAAALVMVMAEARLFRQRAVGPEAGLVATRQQAPTPVVVYRMSMERSAAGPHRVIGLPEAPSELEFALEFAAPPVRGFHAELRGSGGPVWESDQVKPDANGAMAIRVPSALLAPGDYSIRIEGMAPEGGRLALAEFSFRADAHH
jgi:hypothetical protein